MPSSLRIMLFAIVASLAAVAFGAPVNAGETLTFEEQKCSLTLPGDGYFWLDCSATPEALAAFRNDAGLIVLLLADKAPDGYVLNEAATAGIDRGPEKSGAGTKVSGSMMQFNGVPCYQLHIRMKDDNSLGTGRIFVANGYFFQLYVRGSDLPLEERHKLEPIFSAFQFVGKPTVPDPRLVAAEEAGRKVGAVIGRLIGFIVPFTIVLLVVRFFTKRKKPAA